MNVNGECFSEGRVLTVLVSAFETLTASKNLRSILPLGNLKRTLLEKRHFKFFFSHVFPQSPPSWLI
jgi:hypothetical protein